MVTTNATSESKGRTFPELRRRAVTTLQFNMGRLCNQACRHCHVDSSPARKGAEDNASSDAVLAVIELLRRDDAIDTLDLTGGAPELNREFRGLVQAARALGRRVFVRHNFTVQFEPGQDDLPAFFARQGVVLFCSLPDYVASRVARQRGEGVFEQSVVALRRLNEVGYARDHQLELNLVHNPVDASLPAAQDVLERDYRRVLREEHAVEFSRLLTITNQPIHRFAAALERQGRLEDYFGQLEAAFNHATLDGVMCRDSLSVRWDGHLFDCDFNLVQGLSLASAGPRTVYELLERGSDPLVGTRIATARHCFACAAGNGSSFGGALV